MQIQLILTAQNLTPGQCIVISRQQMIKEAEGNLESLLFDHVRESDITAFAKQMEENWGVTMTKKALGDDYIMCKPRDHAKKPEIGVMPMTLWLERHGCHNDMQRAEDLTNAIQRYQLSGKKPLRVWEVELEALIAMHADSVSELKQCPFCGGEHGDEWRSIPKLEELSEEAGGGWRVICYGCGVGTFGSLQKDGAVQVWNRRFL